MAILSVFYGFHTPSTDSLFLIRYQIVNNYLFMVKDYWRINEKRVIDYKVRKQKVLQVDSNTHVCERWNLYKQRRKHCLIS